MTRLSWILLVVLLVVTASVLTAHWIIGRYRPANPWGAGPTAGPTHPPAPDKPPLQPEEQWKESVEQGKKAAQESNWALAEQHLEKALEIARTFPAPDLRMAENEYLLAGVYRQQFKDAEAFLACKDALDIREKALGQDDVLVADTWRGLGQLYEERGLPEDAERCVKRGLEIQQKKLGEEDLAVARTRSELARLYLAHQRPAESERFARQALAIEEQKLKPEDPELIVTRLNLGDALYHQEKYDDLEQETTRTMEIFRKVAGEEHPQLAVLMGQLAAVRQHQKRYEEAEKLLWRAVKIQEEKLKEHRDLVLSLLELADIQLDLKMTGEAESQSRRALAVWDKLKPERQARLTALAGQLARRFYDADKKEVARETLRRTLALIDRVKPPQEALVNEVLQPLAWLSAETGEFESAEKLFKRLLLLQKKVYACKDHPVIFVNLGAYARVLKVLGKEEELMKTAMMAEGLREGAVRRQLDVAQNLRRSGQEANAKRAEEMAERIRNQSFTDPFPQPIPLPSYRLPAP